jgi:hypothetical protein
MRPADRGLTPVSGWRAALLRFGWTRFDEEPCAITVVAKDDCGIVLLASPDGERFRTVDRLAMTAAEADALYDASKAPVLSAADVRDTYGDHIARLRLGRT